MKKFILHISLFCLPILVGSIILLTQPTHKKRAYHYLTEDCEGRGAWMYRRLFESQQPIDIAFLGSSHTINGINDTLINQLLATQSSPFKNTCNLGYCRLGRDLTYVLMKHILEQKKTRVFIVEVLPDEPKFSHPIFPFLAEMKDIVEPQTMWNRSYPNNLYSAAVARLMYVRQDLFKEPYAYKYGLREQSGFSTNTFFADSVQLIAKKERRFLNRHKSHTWTRKINLPYSRAWLANIYALSKKNNCQLIFLYIPPYGSAEKEPIELATYQKYGEVWLPPDTLLENKRNWYDDEHLNLQGAHSFSTWVAGRITKLP